MLRMLIMRLVTCFLLDDESVGLLHSRCDLRVVGIEFMAGKDIKTPPIVKRPKQQTPI